MTHPTTPMEAWQDAKDAEERVFAEEMARTDNGVLASVFGEKAAAAVLEAWKDEQVRELRERVARLIEAANEMEDKLWVLRCNSRDDLDRHAAEKAILMWTDARTLLAGERGA